MDSRGSVSVTDSTTLRNKSCDEHRIVTHAPFYPAQKPLNQTVLRRAEQSSKHRQFKRSGGRNLRCLGDFISFIRQLQYVKTTSPLVRSNYRTPRICRKCDARHTLFVHRRALIAFNASQWPLQSDPGTLPPSPPHAL